MIGVPVSRPKPNIDTGGEDRAIVRPNYHFVCPFKMMPDDPRGLAGDTNALWLIFEAESSYDPRTAATFEDEDEADSPPTSPGAAG
jgi:hypothetical protein